VETVDHHAPLPLQRARGVVELWLHGRLHVRDVVIVPVTRAGGRRNNARLVVLVIVLGHPFQLLRLVRGQSLLQVTGLVVFTVVVVELLLLLLLYLNYIYSLSETSR